MDDDGAREPPTRQRSRGPGGVLAAAVALVLVFLAVRLTSSSSPMPDHDRDRVAPTPQRTHPTEYFDMATRGTLADDAAWVSGVASSPAVADLPPERHVTLATDAPEERIAFVLGRDTDQVVAAWLVGPSGATPEQMALATAPFAVSGWDPVALWDVPPAQWTGGLLVVVGHPGDEISFLLGRSVTAGGEVERAANRLPVTDGIAVAPVGPPPAPSGTLVLVDSPGNGWRTSPVLSDRARLIAEAPVRPADPRQLGGTVDPDRLQSVLRDMVAAYGIPAARISPMLLATGPVGGAGDQAVLVGATLPSGATVAWLGVAGSGPGDPVIRVVRTVPAPAGTALLDRVIAVPAGWAVSRLPLPPGSGPPGWLVVSGPRAGTTAEALDADGDLLASFPLVAGAGVGAVPPGTAGIRVLDDTDRDLGAAPLAELPG
jgi:hypothetical protein